MAKLACRTGFASVAVAGLTALCQCSLFFDLGGLDNGAPGTVDLDAANGGEPDAIDLDAPTDNGGGGDSGNLDAVAEGSADRGAPDVSAMDARAQDAAVDASGDAASFDAAGDGASDAGGFDAGADVSGNTGDSGDAGDSGGRDGAAEGGGIAVGLVAYYPFDETSGTTAADVSGNNQTAAMQGATFASGLRNNAATMNGNGQFVSLPGGIVSSLTDFSIAAWVYPNDSTAHTRIFDFGTGTNTYMFLTPHGGVTRFAITINGANSEQRIDAPTALSPGSWQHVAVTLAGVTGTLYVDGTQVAQNNAMTLNPASLGTTTQTWLGRSQFVADPYLNGQIDEFRIYNRALSAAEVKQLFQQR